MPALPIVGCGAAAGRRKQSHLRGATRRDRSWRRATKMHERSRFASRIRRVRAEVKHLWLSIIGHGRKFGHWHAAAGSQMHNMRLAKRFLVGVLHEVAHPALNVAVIVDGRVNLAVAIGLDVESLNWRR